MTQISFRDASPEDAALLAQLFARSFTGTFGHLYREEDLAAFLGKMDADGWRNELGDPGLAVRIAEADKAAVGFAKVGTMTLPVESDRRATELRQLYVLKPWQGNGVAAMLMDWALERARRAGAEEVYLSVYSENERARRFYARYGFEYVGPYAFMVGNQADEDHIMRLRLGT